MNSATIAGPCPDRPHPRSYLRQQFGISAERAATHQFVRGDALAERAQTKLARPAAEERCVSPRLLGSFRCLGELLDDPLALEPRNVIDEQHTVEVIDFVLDDGCEQAFDILFLQL